MGSHRQVLLLNMIEQSYGDIWLRVSVDDAGPRHAPGNHHAMGDLADDQLTTDVQRPLRPTVGPNEGELKGLQCNGCAEFDDYPNLAYFGCIGTNLTSGDGGIKHKVLYPDRLGNFWIYRCVRCRIENYALIG